MRFLILATTGLLAAALPAPTFAAASDWSKGEHAQVRLVSAGETTGESAEHRLGLHFRLKGDWKVYWRAPGDAGL
ncbi:MAG: copper resistance protein, partial [Rhodospirillales bacterium]|nr:copper resistance protein [Rhodospirillales bacterium]